MGAMRYLPAATLAALALAGCGGSSTSSTQAGGAGSSGSAPAAVSTGADGCNHDAPPKASPKTYSQAPAPPFDTEGATLTMQTSCGTIRFTLDKKLGGAVTDAIAGLVADGYYDGLTFHRVVPDFVEQGGSPTGESVGGAGFTVVQAPPSDYVYQLGDLAMGKTATEPDGATDGQFFIVSGSQGELLPPQYAIIGHATDTASLDTIARIGALGVADGPPSAPVWILSAKVAPK